MILVAPLTVRNHKRIFLLCRYFATKVGHINSTPPITENTNQLHHDLKQRCFGKAWFHGAALPETKALISEVCIPSFMDVTVPLVKISSAIFLVAPMAALRKPEP